MKERDKFEDYIQNKMEGFSSKPEFSAWENIEKNIPSSKPFFSTPIFFVGLFFIGIVLMWAFNYFNNSTTDDAHKEKEIANHNPTILNGEKLFKKNCISCHNSDMKSNSIGPALGGVTQKRTKQWLYDFTRNSRQMIASGDKQAVAVYEKYSKSPMNSFPQLSNEDIDNIYAYVEHIYLNQSPKKINQNYDTIYTEEKIIRADQKEIDVNIKGDSLFYINESGPVDSLLLNGEHFQDTLQQEKYYDMH